MYSERESVLSLSEIKKLVRFAKKNGITHLKMGELELSFTAPKVIATSHSTIPSEGMPGEVDLLFHSAPENQIDWGGLKDGAQS